MLPFGQTVYLWRIHRGLTQEALARKAGLARPNLSALETGRREVTLGTIRALSEALGVSAGALVDGAVPDADLAGGISRRSLERIANHLAGKPVRLAARELRIAETLEPLVGNLKAAHGLRPARPRLPAGGQVPAGKAGQAGTRSRRLQWLKAAHLIGRQPLASLAKRMEQTASIPSQSRR